MTLDELKVGDEFSVINCKSHRLKEMGFFKWASGLMLTDDGNVKMVKINGYKIAVDNLESHDIIVEKKGEK